ncbi:MAG: polysaccharide pyruvyl transferase family protein [Sedimentitalea sp.]
MSEIRILRDLAVEIGEDLKIIVVDSHDPREIYVTGDDVDVREVREFRNLATVWGIFREADLVVDIGGGDSFSDIYGGKRLTRLLLLKYLALFARRPLVLGPQTMGPFAKKRWAVLARPAIARATIVATRDTLSTQYLRQLGLKGEIVEASDVALKLPYDVVQQPNSEAVRVGVNVSGLLMNGGYTGSNQFGLSMDYPTLLRDIIKRFQSFDHACEVHLVPHVLSFKRGAVEDDYQASLDLAAEFEGVVVAPDFRSPSDAKTYIAGLDFFMGARMHACIAAFSSGVPVVPMAYSRKFAGLFGSLGYDKTVDCTTESNDAILAKIFEAFENREAVKTDMLVARDKGLEKLANYETALRDLMREIAART